MYTLYVASHVRAALNSILTFQLYKDDTIYV